MKKIFWYTVGILSLAMVYVGIVVPGIPFSIFLVLSAFAFSKSSDKMHNWIYNHKHFGPFITNWSERKVFPIRLKFVMIAMMTTSLIIMWFTTGNIIAISWTGATMAIAAIWAWRYPSSVEEYDRRKQNNEKIGWLS